LWNSGGICSMDGLGAVRAAISVACIVLARMDRVKAFDHW
jgi:hypothetical protein